MKFFIEALEKDNAINPEFVQEKIITTDGAAILSVAGQLDPGKTYALRKHICRHDEKMPCIAENITAKTLSDLGVV